MAAKAAEPIRFKHWHYLGTFPVGKNELDGDPLSDFGGIVKLFRKYRRDKKQKLKHIVSELVSGGSISWAKLPIEGKRGDVFVRPRDVDFSQLVQGLQSIEVQEVQGWAVAEFNVKRAGQYSIWCPGSLTCYVDRFDTMLTGDMFRTGRIRNTAHLSEGRHQIYVYLKYKGQTQFNVEIKRVPVVGKKTLHFFPPDFLPDVVSLGAGVHDPDLPGSDYGLADGSVIAVPVLNLGTQWREVRFSAQHNSASIDVRVSKVNRTVSYLVAPGQLSSVPLFLNISTPIPPALCPFNFHLKPESRALPSEEQALGSKKGPVWTSHEMMTRNSLKLSIRCRTTRQSFVFTFLDHDGSVSRAAAIAPLSTKSTELLNDSAGVVVSQHGTGVDVSMQADSYKYKPLEQAHDDNSPYIFGIEDAWVLAPTRNGAHNWEYTGFLSVVAALERLASALPKWLARRIPKPDVHHRVVFAGHSMGGHGAWQSATHLPDRAIAVVSAAGWIRKEYYGDSNRFFVHDVGHAHVDPSLKSVLEACFTEFNSDLHSANLLGVPGGVLARIGANDRAVPPWQVRRMVRLLREIGVNVTYEELPGKDHWWWDSTRANDGGVLNDKTMRDYFRLAFLKADRYDHLPDEFETLTFNPASTESRAGCRILQQLNPFQISKLKFKKEIKHDKWSITTKNVGRIALDPRILCSRVELCKVSIDKNLTYAFQADFMVEFCLESAYAVEVQNDAASTPWLSARAGDMHLWKVCDLQSSHMDSSTSLLASSKSYIFEKYQRGPHNYGPARQVYASPFVIVVGCSTSLPDVPKDGNDSNCLRNKNAALYLSNTHVASASTHAPIVKAHELGQDDERVSNLILIGGPAENIVTSKLMLEMTASGIGPPVKFGKVCGELCEPSVTIGPCTFRGSDIGILFLAPSWDDKAGEARLRLVLAGLDPAGLRNIMSLAQPTIPPMMRAPFSNQVPDFVVVDRRVLARGAGGILAAGYWGAGWEWKPEASWWTC